MVINEKRLLEEQGQKKRNEMVYERIEGHLRKYETFSFAKVKL